MVDILQRIGIDWRLLLFQVVNFLILLFILNKIIYKPLLKFLDARQKKIEEGLKRTQEIEGKWQEMNEMKKKELAKIEKRAVEIIETARKEAAAKEKEILREADIKATKIITEAKDSISKEKEKILKDIKEEMSNYIIVAAEKVLKRSIKEGDEKKITEEIIGTIKENG